MPAVILILIGVAIYAIFTIGWHAWIGICLASLCVMLMIALNEASVKPKKDDGEHDESPKSEPKKFKPKKKNDDDNDFWGM